MLKTIKGRALRGALICAVSSLGLVATAAQADGDGKWRGGENVYAKVCSHCHEAGIGPVIKGRQLPPEYITTIARHGFRAMPAFRSSFIDDAALQSVAEFVSNSAAPKE